LLAFSGFHDDGAMRLEKLGPPRLVISGDLGRYANSRGLDNAAGDALVIAYRHGDRGCELAQRLAAMQGTAAVGQPEETAFRIGNVDGNSAAPGLVDDNLGVAADAAAAEAAAPLAGVEAPADVR
jgi:hypothetical protein